MINKKYNVLYVHIPKTGGVSVEKALKGRVGDHRDVKRYIREIGETAFNSYFSFAFVRNPWDKMVSNYFYDKKGGVNGNGTNPLFQTGKLPFNEWVKKIESIKPNKRRTYTHQIDWLKNLSGDICVDYIGRFEKFDNDWNDICRRNNIDINLPHHNKTNRDSNYRIYYKLPNGKWDHDAIDKVRELHQKDINEFGYRFIRG